MERISIFTFLYINIYGVILISARCTLESGIGWRRDSSPLLQTSKQHGEKVVNHITRLTWIIHYILLFWLHLNLCNDSSIQTICFLKPYRHVSIISLSILFEWISVPEKYLKIKLMHKFENIENSQPVKWEDKIWYFLLLFNIILFSKASLCFKLPNNQKFYVCPVHGYS